MANIIKLCLTAFQLSLQQTLPAECVKRSLRLFSANDSSVLVFNNRRYIVKHNVHIVAIGKAAYGMVCGAEEVLEEHLVDGIASVPTDVTISMNKKTQFYKGAAYNLPDKDSLNASEKIVEFIQKINRQNDQIFLFLISGGGSALLSAPIVGLSLDEKLNVIRILMQNGANIKQLNIVRSALSTLKGGKLAQLGAPSKMIGLVMSDIVGDPIELISSGPTVLRKSEPLAVLKIFEELNIAEKIPQKIYNLLRTVNLELKETMEVDVNNAIIANNHILLDTMVQTFSQENITVKSLVVTSVLEGDASDLGAKFADLIVGILENKRENFYKICDLLHDFQPTFNEAEKSEFLNKNSKYFVLLFGGESTVRFPSHPISSEAKGGRNQELILAAFKRLSEKYSVGEITDISAEDDFNDSDGAGKGFALFSLGTDGQDGPTDATGAFITHQDIRCFSKNQSANMETLTRCLEGKNSYEFWSSKWRDGKNLVKLGKTGTNLMDVQILAFKF